jgi:hypothetical protein
VVLANWDFCACVCVFFWFSFFRPGFVYRTLVETTIMTKTCFACVHTFS